MAAAVAKKNVCQSMYHLHQGLVIVSIVQLGLLIWFDRFLGVLEGCELNGIFPDHWCKVSACV